MARVMTGTISACDGTQRVVGRFEFVALMAAVMSLGALAIDGMLPALDEIAMSFGVDDPNRRQLVVGVYLLAAGAGALVPGSARCSPMAAPSFQCPTVQGRQWAVRAVRVRSTSQG